MSKNHRYRPVANGGFQHAARVYMSFLYRAFAEKSRIQDPTLRVEAKDIEYFLRTTGHQRNKILDDEFRFVESWSVARYAVVKITSRYGWKQRKEYRRLFSYTFHAG